MEGTLSSRTQHRVFDNGQLTHFVSAANGVTATKIGFFLGEVAFGLCLGFLLWGLGAGDTADYVTSPDGVLFVEFAVVMLAATTVLSFMTGLRKVLDNREWNAFGLFFVIAFGVGVVWYRLFWEPSPFVAEPLCDEPAYIEQALLFLRQRDLWVLPDAHLVIMNSWGHSFLMAVLFNVFGVSKFYVIAVQILLSLWSSLVMAALAVVPAGVAPDTSNRSKLFVIGAFQVTPNAIFYGSVITKDMLGLFGVAVSLLGYHRISERWHLGWVAVLGGG